MSRILIGALTGSRVARPAVELRPWVFLYSPGYVLSSVNSSTEREDRLRSNIRSCWN